MGQIKQYLPAYFSGFELETRTFNSLEELFKIDWVKEFSNDAVFFRYSIASGHILMAEYDNGFEQEVVGFIPIYRVLLIICQ